MVSQPTENLGWSKTCFNSQTARSVPGWSLKLRMCSNAHSCVLGEFRRTSEETEAFWRGHREWRHIQKETMWRNAKDARYTRSGGQRKKKPCWTPECSSGIKMTLVVYSHTMLNVHNNNCQMKRAYTTQLSLNNPPNSKNYYFKALRFCFVLIFWDKVSLCSPDWPETQEICLSLLPKCPMGLKVCTTMLSPFFLSETGSSSVG